jgi:hypothetical protein
MLSEHMREQHFRCDICANDNVIRWFATIELIQVHFHESHHACTHPICLQQGFIVFATAIELQLHRIQVHNDDAPAALDFRPETTPQREPDIRRMHLERMAVARDKLTKSLRAISGGEGDKVGKVFRLMDKLEKETITVPDFLRALGRTCGENTDRLFGDVASAVSVPRIRARLVMARTGTVPCLVHTSESCPTLQEPDMAAPPPRPPPPRQDGRKKGRQKKIVLMTF